MELPIIVSQYTIRSFRTGLSNTSGTCAIFVWEMFGEFSRELITSVFFVVSNREFHSYEVKSGENIGKILAFPARVACLKSQLDPQKFFMQESLFSALFLFALRRELRGKTRVLSRGFERAQEGNSRFAGLKYGIVNRDLIQFQIYIFISCDPVQLRRWN